MAFSDYQQTIAWHSALELGPKLTQLAEELPSGEQNGLAQALLNLAIDLPSAVAIDIQTGSTTRNAIIVRMQTVLELTARIYPALDNINVENALADRIERFTGPSFNETIPVPAPVVSEQDEEPIATSPIDQPATKPEQPVTIQNQPDPNLPPLLPQDGGIDTSGTHISLTPNPAPTEAPAIVPANIQQ